MLLTPSPLPVPATLACLQVHRGFDQIVSAIGRVPVTAPLHLDRAGVTPLKSGHIAVDEFQTTSVSSVLALGDVCGRVELTPMAIAAGRRLADRLYGGMPEAKADYDMVPTVVFSHPVIGTIGLTEQEARKQFREEDIKVTCLWIACSSECCLDFDADVFHSRVLTCLVHLPAFLPACLCGCHVISCHGMACPAG